MKIKYVNGGWILLHRKIMDSEAWQICSCEQRSMMIICLLKANHKAATWWDGKEVVSIPRGSFVTGRKKFARETKSGEQRVRTFWKKMEKVGFLTTKSTNRHSMITVCNYDVYQTMEKRINQQINQPATSQQPQTINNNNNNKEKGFLFESLWTKYPNKIGQDQAKKAFMDSVKTAEDQKKIEIALTNYLKYCKSNSTWGYKPQHGRNWFKCWRDWVDYKEKPAQTRGGTMSRPL